jgi:hypothetical protein
MGWRTYLGGTGQGFRSVNWRQERWPGGQLFDNSRHTLRACQWIPCVVDGDVARMRSRRKRECGAEVERVLVT